VTIGSGCGHPALDRHRRGRARVDPLGEDMRSAVVLQVAAVAVLCGSAARAESLGQTAARERARRARQAGQAKAYTDGDLDRTRVQGGSPGAMTLAPGNTAASPAPGQPVSASSQPAGSQSRSTADAEHERRRQEEARWRQRAADLRRELAAAQAEAARLESETNGAVASSLGLCTPSPYHRERAARLADQLAAARRQVAALQQALVDLEEEARRARVPPGWLRE
jgi:hypothetical protein